MEQAEKKLNELDPKIVEYHVLRQISNKVIRLQESLINEFLAKGVLFPMDAAILIEEVDKQRDHLKEEHWFLHSYAKRRFQGGGSVLDDPTGIELTDDETNKNTST